MNVCSEVGVEKIKLSGQFMVNAMAAKTSAKVSLLSLHKSYPFLGLCITQSDLGGYHCISHS